MNNKKTKMGKSTKIQREIQKPKGVQIRLSGNTGSNSKNTRQKNTRRNAETQDWQTDGERKTKELNTQKAIQRQVKLIRTLTSEGKQEKDREQHDVAYEDEPFKIKQETTTKPNTQNVTITVWNGKLNLKK